MLITAQTVPRKAASDFVRAQQRLTIVVADDDVVDRTMFRRAVRLSRLDAIIVEAHDGGEAFEKLERLYESGREIVVLTDIDMPGMDGLSFVRAIRDDARLSATPIFAWSGDASPAVVDALFDSRVHGFFLKCEVMRLIATLELYVATESSSAPTASRAARFQGFPALVH